MPVFGITGGIATGKSTFGRARPPPPPVRFFDADACAHELLANDGEVRAEIRRAFDLSEEAPLDRPGLRDLVFQDSAKRKQLEQILHPRIRASWQQEAEKVGSEWLVVDIPLLYETDAQCHFDRVVVVACSWENQRSRLRQLRGLSDEMAEKVIAAQLDLRMKIAKADHLIWNDSTLTCMEGQTSLLLGALSKRYG